MSIAETATKVAHKGLFVVKKYSPEILTGVGILGVVTAGVLGARATLKLEPIIDEVQDNANSIRVFDSQLGEKNTKELVKVYSKGSFEIVKLYAPTATLALGSIGCIIAAHGIMRRRNVALIAAYKVLETGFSEYRKRVVEEYGIEKDRDFVAGVREEVTTDENGKKVTKVLTDPNKISGYARFFDETSSEWQRNPEYNMMFLKAQQQYANDLLKARGHLFLNEVYDSLGLERSQAGALVGWTYGKEGDNFVDFNIYDFANEKKRQFVNGAEKSILLDFNVDGPVYDKI